MYNYYNHLEPCALNVLSKYTRKFLTVLLSEEDWGGVLQCPPILKEEGVKGGNFLVSIPKEKMIAKKPKKKTIPPSKESVVSLVQDKF